MINNKKSVDWRNLSKMMITNKKSLDWGNSPIKRITKINQQNVKISQQDDFVIVAIFLGRYPKSIDVLLVIKFRGFVFVIISLGKFPQSFNFFLDNNFVEKFPHFSDFVFVINFLGVISCWLSSFWGNVPILLISFTFPSFWGDLQCY